jgi:plastocyanin
VVGPNDWDDVQTAHGTAGDSQLEDLAITPFAPAVTVADGGDGVSAVQTTIEYASSADPIIFGHTIVIGNEQMLVTNVSTATNTLTVNRAVNGTTAASHAEGSPIRLRPQTADAAVLEFDFVPQTDTALFRFVFASDEYNEWANTPFNDVFAFYINGNNCALVPNTSQPISVNTINNGNTENPFPPDPGPQNPSLFRNNDLQQGGGSINTEMDGLTVVLTCIAGVTEDATNHIKLAIADANDEILDSVVFLQANSLVGSGPGDSDCNEFINSIDALHVLRASAQLPTTAQCIANGDVNCSGVLNSIDALLILRFAALLPIPPLPPGCPPIGSGPPGTGTPTGPPTPTPTPGGGIQVDMQDQGNSGVFVPAQFNVTAGQAFQVELTNSGPDFQHNMRIDGNDSNFYTPDDLVTVCNTGCFDPTLLDPGGTGQVSGTLTAPGTYDFLCDVHPDMLGTITAN